MKILGTIALFIAGTVEADCESDCNDCCVSTLQIGGSYTRADIKVHGHSSFQGNLGGVQGSYEYKPWNGIYGGVRVAWKEGETNSSHSHTHRKLTYVDAQERIGYTFASCCNNWSATFFTGFGYRYLSHRFKFCREANSIKFEYNEFYVPVGFLSEYIFCCRWSVGLNATWMPQVFPTVKISPLKGARWSLKNTLGNVLVELPLTYYFTDDQCYAVILKPFYERWEDGKSTARTFCGRGLDLPKNTYNFWGFELNFALSF